MIQEYTNADYAAVADRETALNEARAETILAAQSRAQFETDQATMRWHEAQAQLDAKNKAREMTRQAGEDAARRTAVRCIVSTR